LSYPDAQRYRLGTNYEQIPVNRCPFATNNYQRDGQMRTDGNGRKPNYFPNSFDEMQIDQAYKEPLRSIAVLQTGTIVIVKGKTIISPNREIYLKLCPSSSNKTP
jgi:catalase